MYEVYFSMREWNDVLNSMASLEDITTMCETAPSFTLEESLENVRELRDCFAHPPDRWPLITTIDPSLCGEKEMKHVRTATYHLRSLCVLGDSSIESHLAYTR